MASRYVRARVHHALDLSRPDPARPRAGPRRGRRADTRPARHHPAEVPGRTGNTPAACVHEGAAQPVHGAEPAQQHPQRHLDDGRLPRTRPTRTLARGALECDVACAVRVAHLPFARIPGERLPVADRAAAGAGDRPTVARAARQLRDAERPRPAGHQGVPELRRRRLLLPRRARPRLERHQDEPSVRASGLGGRPNHHEDGRLRPDQRARAGRAHQLGAARLPRPHLVRLEEERQGRNPQHEDAQDPRHPARRGHPELVHGRPSRHLRGVEQAHVPLPRAQWQAADSVEGHVRQLRRREARPGRRRLGHHADDHERRLRRDHRQRGPDERGRVPQGREAEARAAPGGVPGAGVRAGSERHRELAHHERSLAVRGEQLRLPGPVRAELRRTDHSRASPGWT